MDPETRYKKKCSGINCSADIFGLMEQEDIIVAFIVCCRDLYFEVTIFLMFTGR
jgi:hypothetical protein